MRVAGCNHYHLTTSWQVDAPVDLVWGLILDCEAWPQWWKGVESVELLEVGEPNGVGARQRYTWKGMLPYRLRFVSCVTRVEPMCLLEGRVEGDVRGTGRWHFSQENDRTIVRYEWQVHTTRWWMNLLAPFARPVFRWSHDVLMRNGAAGLQQRLSIHRHLHGIASS